MASAGSPTETTTVEHPIIRAGTPAVEGPKQTKVNETVVSDATASEKLKYDQDQANESSDAIVYKEEYLQSNDGHVVHVEDVDPKTGGRNGLRKESRVLEVVDVYFTPSAEKPKDGLLPVSVKGQSYIRVVSPTVISALRHVVNYYPSQDLSGETVTIYEPYSVVVHHEEELKEYRDWFAPDNPATATASDSCSNRLTYNHVGVLLDYVNSKIGAAVRAERERNARGYTSPDMEWLAFKPGTDVYYDHDADGKWSPYVIKKFRPRMQNGHVIDYSVHLWNLDIDSDRPELLGLNTISTSLSYTGPDVELFGRTIFPCSAFPDGKTILGRERDELRKFFEDRGRMFVQLLKRGCYQFEGTSITQPIKTYNGLVMIWMKNPGHRRLGHHFALDVSGFKAPVFDKKMINDLVLAQDTKDMIVDLTKLFVEEKGTHGEQADATTSGSLLDMSAWSADFVKGKGEGLIFLLHGKPGVGKTYTADIGTHPEMVEASLRRWFSIAQNWGAIMLIDEADVFMEQRKVQDLVRNNLVAGFLRALEYYQGILFLTTNRVGTFDEAFISRIHITIHYANFTDESRAEVWESFFRKLQSEREGKVKILEETRDYVTEREVRELEWNAFQIAVALAQVENDCDARGRIQIKRKHIRSTVNMSRNFKSYLKELYQKDETQRAAAWGHRYDAFGQSSANEGNFM
ncbi:ATPAse [Lasiodiplodia theobromae]|uniref:ATPAse n=1 Tax=Lasiodiplodia theobromae TaxID=45133 RepID=UPI0015C3AA24|nr:ATPAse [Lasiodiplodia theobromae]KAF4546170.1 ATPAse [Lasiodiplodia theobromae]